ncbi:integrase, partial [Streptomyces sp. NPDC001634]
LRFPRAGEPQPRRVHRRRASGIWNQNHLLHTLREFETSYNEHRPHRTLKQAAPLRPLPEPISVPGHISHREVRRRNRLGGTLHEYQHAA